MFRLLCPAVCVIVLALPAQAFCGFYVARADGELFNEASKVVYVRDGSTSTITMASDYTGDPNDFALIVPAPVVLREDQIKTVPSEIVDHLDAYSAPRLVEYRDEDPCNPIEMMAMSGAIPEPAPPVDLGVTIEAQYEVDEYDVLILSAQESDGLITWLRQEDYTIPDGAEDTVQMYIDGGMKFFVARVNLERHRAAGSDMLTPLQISFQSDDFMLPIQLGKINSVGTQDMILMSLTRRGRVEVVNYDAATLPTDVSVPVFVEELFPRFYRDVFANALLPHDTGIALEYGWDMGWCDPCAADPLTDQELAELGVDWLTDDTAGGQNVYVTRLHARYTADTMKQDLMLRVTDIRDNFQGRYIMNQPWAGSLECEFAEDYIKTTRARIQAEADTLERLTGWDREEIDARLAQTVPERFLP